MFDKISGFKNQEVQIFESLRFFMNHSKDQSLNQCTKFLYSFHFPDRWDTRRSFYLLGITLEEKATGEIENSKIEFS